MSAIVFQNTGATIVYSTVCSDAYQRKHQSPVLLTLYEENSPVTGGCLAQRVSTAENTVPIEDLVMLRYFLKLRRRGLYSLTLTAMS